MSTNEPSSRARNRNFDHSEKEILLHLVEKHKSVLQSKLTNNVTVNKKNKIWESITAEINSIGLCNRTVKEVRNKWSNIHQKAKKEKADKDFHRHQTGGGPQLKPMSPTSERVITLFEDCPTFKGLKGVESIPDDEDTVQLVSTDSMCTSPKSAQFIAEAISAKGDAPPNPKQATSEEIGHKPLKRETHPETANNEKPSSSKQTTGLVNERKRKIKPDDVTSAQYEVLQLQKEKILKQITYYHLLNLKLSKEIES